MKPSWIPVFIAMLGISCGVFALFPTRWSPAMGFGVLAGMVLYFVAFSQAVVRVHATTGVIPPLFGPRGVMPIVVVRTFAFLLILAGVAYVYFEQRSFFDMTWPVLILAAWNVADGMLDSRKGLRVE
jgi:hypothetical protein